MSKLQNINVRITENINEVISVLPSDIASLYLESLLDLASTMVQAGDITTDIIGGKKFKLTAYVSSGVRTLTVNLDPE